MRRNLIRSLSLALMLMMLVALAAPMAMAESNECQHVWDEGQVTTEASCQKAGEMTYTCTLCAQTKTEPIEKLQHVPVQDVTKEATVKTHGYARKKCELCGYYLLAANGRESWISNTKNATSFGFYLPYTLTYQYTLDGVASELPGNFRVLANNDYYGSEGLTTVFPEIPAATAPQGYEISEFPANRYEVLVNGAVAGHSYVPGNSTGMTYAWMNNTDTSYKVIAVYVISVPELSITQNGATLSAEIANSNENLAYTYQWYKDGASIDGAEEKTLDVSCQDLGVEFSVNVKVTNAADSVIGVVGTGKEATASYTMAHYVVTDPAVPATCEGAGLTEGSHCSVCGTVFTAQETIAPIGHKYGSAVDAKDGKTHTRVCSNDASHVLSEEHRMGDWIVSKEATQTEEGSIYRECKDCGYKQTAATPAGNSAPKTGDESGMGFFAVLAVLSLCGAAGVALTLKKKQGC